MDTPSLGERVVRKAVKKLGSVEAVATRLQLQRAVVLGFLDGSRAVPDTILMRTLDLIVDEIFTAQAAKAPVVDLLPRRATSAR